MLDGGNILARLAEMALGDILLAVEAAQFLMLYTFGMPVQELADADERF